MTALLPAAAAVLGGLTLLWGLSVARRDVGIVDIAWGPVFVIIAGVTAATRSEPLSGAHWLLAAMVSVWGLRLGIYLARRNLGHDEDRRYAAMRQARGPSFWWVSLGQVFWLQGLLALVISLPVQLALQEPAAALGPLHVIGGVVWLVGLGFEAIGDAQLARFLADPGNRGRVMDRGLWRYTRHPNYFGDFTVWWGYFAFALGCGAPWWTAAGPALMSLLLMRVSGVTLLEKSIGKRRVGYEAYVRRTSAFFPWPPRPEPTSERAPEADAKPETEPETE